MLESHGIWTISRKHIVLQQLGLAVLLMKSKGVNVHANLLQMQGCFLQLYTKKMRKREPAARRKTACLNAH